ncbi:hypothetical protein LTR16_000573 [Cryomyces antarcticus]|uniref:Xylanolytic transcriptional activator regulatory domain-containing protein n=1 Tax=Cryomyces antarcticus TaxID=329879 RepID=A0ABR0M012_9PEZI|nr:hypothetical protein LTR04_005793 [Oleoguttula sp. CCFEE 6159]KAK5257461.1 hypothetical protein LTR16_000573 [Cryomyces antarcticus]
MSSLKQVQDLEKQLVQAKQHISQLRSMLQERGATDLDAKTTPTPLLNLPEIGPNTERRYTPPTLEDFDHVRKRLRTIGRGIFKPPPPYRQQRPQASYSLPSPKLPPKHVADRLISQYHGAVHVYAPLLHWPTFVDEYEMLYRAGTFQGIRHIWVPMFFSILACGTLETQDSSPGSARPEAEGTGYVETCIQSLDLWTDELTIDHARTALLLSIFFMELNLKSAAWIWLGSAIRISQDVGLHYDSGPWPIVEAEVRRRVWWSIYNWDRLVSLEVGRPLLIDDDDCEVGWPTPVDDRYIQLNGIVMPPDSQSPPNGLIAVIPVVRFISQLKKTLKARVVAPATLETYDAYFQSIMLSYPEPYQITSGAPLDPRLLCAATTLQVARFFLYRHNLSPACRRSERKAALDRCVAAAKDTATYISRSLRTDPSFSDSSQQPQSASPSWKARLRSMAPGMYCTHLWRCTLVLAFRAEYATALVCVCAMSAVGDLRRANVACGRNLAFFLEQLIDRVHRGEGNLQQLLADEEMLAYASGDMQGCPESSWAWTGSETGTKLNSTPLHPPSDITQPQPNGDPTAGTYPHKAPLRMESPSETDSKEWGGWERIERMLTQLLDEQRKSYSHGPHTLQHPIHYPAQLQQPPNVAGNGAMSSGPNSGSSSRISIANIM